MKKNIEMFEEVYYLKNKIGVISLGCAKNRVDTENMLGILAEKGYTFVTSSEEADVIIINTCGFIQPAKEESIEEILGQVIVKNQYKNKKIIVAGCLAQRYSDELASEIPEVDAIIGTEYYSKIDEIVEGCLKGKKYVCNDRLQWEADRALPRILTTPKATAYLKIAEGCDNFCSYCAIPQIRGRYRSRTIDSLYEEAVRLANAGTKELIVIAQDISRFGYDMGNRNALIELLDKLASIDSIKWIRLLYCYPDRIDTNLIKAIKNNSKVCHYIDIPIQHVNTNILKAMNRNTTSDDIKRVLDNIRTIIPDVIIRTSYMVGFPGEGEREFNELLDFIQTYPIEHVGVFMYSQEEGTRAAKLPDQIDDEEKLRRRNLLMATQQRISKRLNRRWVGGKYDVLIEGRDSEEVYFGRSYGQAPEVDGKVYLFSDRELAQGDFVEVEIKKAYNYDLLGDYHEFSK